MQRTTQNPLQSLHHTEPQFDQLEIRLLLSGGDNYFEITPTYPVGHDPRSMVSADVDGDGATDLITANHDDNMVSVLRNLGDGTYAAQVSYRVGNEPTSVTSADVDGDGYIDLITANVYDYMTEDSVSILRNRGDGTFAAHVEYPVGNLALCVTSADIDGDKAIDLITVNANSNNISVLRNIGDGTFETYVTYAVEDYPSSVIPVDVDRDGAIDLVTTNTDSDSVSVLRNIGDGTFENQVSYAVEDDPFSVTSADVDGDGMLDLVAANYGAYSDDGDSVSVLRNLGNGTFEEQKTYAVGKGPFSITSADVDGDGAIDLITANWTDDTVSVLQNLGNGVFAEQIAYAIKDKPRSITSVDVNNDGAIDLVTANNGDNTVSVLNNCGNGTFAASFAYKVGDSPHSILPIDVNGDGDVDLITANNDDASVSVLRSLGNGTFAKQEIYPVGNGPLSILPIDIDNDGMLDLVTNNHEYYPGETGNTVSVLRNLGNGTFAEQVTYIVGAGPRSILSIDINGDGAEDLVTANYDDNTISVLRNLGDGIFAEHISYRVGYGPSSITSEDFDGDGAMDLATTDSRSNTVSILHNLGDGTFAPRVIYAAGNSPSFIKSVDIDRNNSLDLIFANTADATISVLRNLGEGTFVEQKIYTDLGSQVNFMTLGDCNNDGAMDLFFTDHYEKTVSVMHNNGCGIFGQRVAYILDYRPSHISLADTDGDGSQDIITINHKITVLRNLGNGAFAGQVSYEVGGTPSSIALVDVDNKGTVDIVTTLSGDDTVSVLRNTGYGKFAAQATYTTGDRPYSLTSADVDGNGSAELISTNYSDNTISILHGITNQKSYALDKYIAKSLKPIDVNGDGAMDLAWLNYRSSPDYIYTVSVSLNLGNGKFATRMTYKVGKSPISLIAADVNGDGSEDLITLNHSDDTISVLLNLGDGIFANQAIYGVGHHPILVKVTDINNDGKMDLVAVCSGRTPDYNGTVSVLLNLGDGTFEEQAIYTTGNNPRSLTIIDVDNNSSMDLVVANAGLSPDYSGSISVLRNLGDGTFTEQVIYTVGDAPKSVIAADVDNDEVMDLLVTNQGLSPNYNGSISVLRNLGNGTFAAQATYAVGRLPDSVVAVDVNRDGKVDMITANVWDDTVSVLHNRGNGIFAEQETYAAGPNPQNIVAEDINGDNAIDIIVANTNGNGNTVSILRNIGNGTFTSKSTCTVGIGLKSITLADINGDGAKDLLTVHNESSGHKVSIWTNQANGIFSGQYVYTTGEHPRSIIPEDINNDSEMDLVWVISGKYYPNDKGMVSVLRNLGEGTFADPVTYTVGYAPSSVTSADFNGDGAVDLVTVNSGQYPDYYSTVSVLFNLGDGTFAEQVSYSVGKFAGSFIAADVDDNATMDLVVANAGVSPDFNGSIWVLSNLGDGTFTTQVAYTGYVGAVTSADVNGDGMVDLVATIKYGNILVLLNLGDGTFAPQKTYAMDAHLSSITLEDVNGDGAVDLIATNNRFDGGNNINGTVSVLLNLGNGTFKLHRKYFVGVQPKSVIGADVDGDGAKDLATANSLDDTISVLRNLWEQPIPKFNADFNNDGHIGLLDLDIIGRYFGTTSGATKATGDANGDGKVSLLDLDIFGRTWGMSTMSLQSSATTANSYLTLDAASSTTPAASFHTLDNLLADDDETARPLVLF